MSNLSNLAKLWLTHKSEEDTARNARHEIEARMALLVDGPEEGTSHGREGRFDVEVKRGLNRSIDPDAYASVKDRIRGFDPVKLKPSLDLKYLRAIETANPEIYKICQQFITVKPAKPAVKVKVVDEDN